MTHEVRVLGIPGIPEVRPGDDLAALIVAALRHAKLAVASGDVLVVTQKVVSKAEGRIVRLSDVTPSDLAVRWAKQYDRDARHMEVVLRESKRILRMDGGVIIAETHHGFKCANAGVDASNVPDAETVVLLPLDSDASAERVRVAVRSGLGVEVGVIVSDTFGRPWREGATNVAIGVAGMSPVQDYRGKTDAYGHPLRTTVIAVADELASTAELVTGKSWGVPVALIKGYQFEPGNGGAAALLRPPDHDLFR